ncbi:MAG: NAD(P)H-dependent glycerol-3-phosphate dehydrogenase, partial [Gammaproteobacteria bacterium]
MASIGVLGAGSWGTALAVHLAAAGHQVVIWGHLVDHVDRLRADGSNEEFLPGVPFPPTLTASSDLAQALEADELLVVVPSQVFRPVLEQCRVRPPTRIAWATKGLEYEGAGFLHDVARQVFPDLEALAVVSGPTFASEVARGLPTALTVASDQADFAGRWAALLSGPRFRAYTATDMVGVQLGGAVKNVLAIAAGASDGLGFGANSRAALITRGLKEMMRLGQAMGAQASTFMGLAGQGDLVLTCTDDQSRNRRLGLALGRGESI